MSHQIEKNYKAPLSTTIQKEYNKLLAILNQIPPRLWTEKVINFTTGKASVTDIVAYQIGWGTLLLRWYTAGVQGKTPEMPGEGFTTWDYNGLAQHFYRTYAHDNQTEQLQIFHDLVQQILIMVETEYETGNLDKIGVWPWCTLASGKQWPLSKWIVINTSSPYKRASSTLKKTFIMSSNSPR